LSSLVIPNVFTNGTVINSSPFNSNFGAITTWSTAIDNTNIGPAGLFPNQLLPTTGAQATFGATAVGVGYKFLANDATAVPLTVSGVSGQSAALLTVTLPGAGNVFFIDELGRTQCNALATGTIPLVVNMVNSQTVAGFLINGAPAISGNFLEIDFSGGATALKLSSAGILTVPQGMITNGSIFANGNTGATASGVAGEVYSNSGISTGKYHAGGATTQGAWEFGNNFAGAWSSILDAGGFAPVHGGAYTNSSDAKYKTNVAPITGGLETLMRLKPSSYDWIADKQADLGFIAQDVEPILPQLVRTSREDESKGLVYTGFTALNTAAIQEMVTKLKAAGVAGF
jgi:hypothetical protein